MSETAEVADAVVVGAGPGGSAPAADLAQHGLDVVLLEKARFPRDKICGDGLTPRAVKELVSLGVDTTGWQRTKGLRIKGGGHTLTLAWPEGRCFVVDHVVPLALGGPDTLANKQAAHRDCNRAKSDRIDGGPVIRRSGALR